MITPLHLIYSIHFREETLYKGPVSNKVGGGGATKQEGKACQPAVPTSKYEMMTSQNMGRNEDPLKDLAVCWKWL